jgi:hypothetical protein
LNMKHASFGPRKSFWRLNTSTVQIWPSLTPQVSLQQLRDKTIMPFRSYAETCISI